MAERKKKTKLFIEDSNGNKVTIDDSEHVWKIKPPASFGSVMSHRLLSTLPYAGDTTAREIVRDMRREGKQTMEAYAQGVVDAGFAETLHEAMEDAQRFADVLEPRGYNCGFHYPHKWIEDEAEGDFYVYKTPPTVLMADDIELGGACVGEFDIDIDNA